MKDGKKNLFDTFLEKYDEYSSKKNVDIETYYRPSKGKSIFGFIFCLIMFIILIRFFHVSIVYFVILIGVLIILIYYALNLFTKKGFIIKKKHSIPEKYLISEDEEDYNNYDIDNELEDIEDVEEELDDLDKEDK